MSIEIGEREGIARGYREGAAKSRKEAEQLTAAEDVLQLVLGRFYAVGHPRPIGYDIAELLLTDEEKEKLRQELEEQVVVDKNVAAEIAMEKLAEERLRTILEFVGGLAAISNRMAENSEAIATKALEG